MNVEEFSQKTQEYTHNTIPLLYCYLFLNITAGTNENHVQNIFVYHNNMYMCLCLLSITNRNKTKTWQSTSHLYTSLTITIQVQVSVYTKYANIYNMQTNKTFNLLKLGSLVYKYVRLHNNNNNTDTFLLSWMLNICELTNKLTN